MTIEEKVGQLTLSSGLINAERPDRQIVQGQVGAILWLIDVKPSGFDVWIGEDSTAALHAVFAVTK